MPGIDPAVPHDWRAIADRAVQKLVDSGYRANVSQSPPLIGASPEPRQGGRAGAVMLDRSGPQPRVPAASEAEGGSLADKADAILGKVNTIPFEAIGETSGRSPPVNQLPRPRSWTTASFISTTR